MTAHLGVSQVRHETSDETGRAFGESIGFIELLLGHVLFIKCAIELVLYLTDRPFRVREKLDELSIAPTLETFRDV